MPVGVTLTIVHDRTATIRASIHDVQFTLVLSVALVVLVVLIFLRTIRATIIAGVALPLSLIATFGVMWFCGFSLDNLSLMALTIGTGFVVDDAIVMIENIVRHIEEGEAPFDAALRGAREIGFTVISLTLSLIAVFIPLLFMTGLVGRMFREFALTLDHRRRRLGGRVADPDADDVQPPAAAPGRRRRKQRFPAGSIAPSTATVELYRRTPGMGAAPPDADAASRRSQRWSPPVCALHHHAQGLPAAAGHRADHGGDGSGTDGLVRRDAAAAGGGRGRASRRTPTWPASSRSSG